jgi:hypothetical protein
MRCGASDVFDFLMWPMTWGSYLTFWIGLSTSYFIYLLWRASR